jgi:hypothetical protein
MLLILTAIKVLSIRVKVKAEGADTGVMVRRDRNKMPMSRDGAVKGLGITDSPLPTPLVSPLSFALIRLVKKERGEASGEGERWEKEKAKDVVHQRK